MNFLLIANAHFNKQCFHHPPRNYVDNKENRDFNFNKLERYAAGKNQEANFWFSVFRHALLNEFLYKDIESYGLLKMTDKGKQFVSKLFNKICIFNFSF